MWDQVVFAFVTLFGSSSQENWLGPAWQSNNALLLNGPTALNDSGNATHVCLAW